MKKEHIGKNLYDNFEIKNKIKADNNDVLLEEEIENLHKVYDGNVYSKGKQDLIRNFLFACYRGLIC